MYSFITPQNLLMHDPRYKKLWGEFGARVTGRWPMKLCLHSGNILVLLFRSRIKMELAAQILKMDILIKRTMY